MRFSGSDSAKQMSRIFAENVHDLTCKVDRGGNKDFEPGFLHTSTMRHEGTCYYDNMWSRDGGRGLIELCRLGFSEDALLVSRYFLNHINFDDHWGRIIGDMDVTDVRMKFETDGNAMALLGLYNTWKINGKTEAIAKELLEGAWPVVLWVKKMMEESPYGDLMPCITEMAGNPNARYMVYAIYPNYGMTAALAGLSQMASHAGIATKADMLSGLSARLSKSLDDLLVSRKNIFNKGMGLVAFGEFSPVPEGCWKNGIDGRNGGEYILSEWDGTSWPVYHWTRQIPFVFDCDAGSLALERNHFHKIHTDSYNYLHGHMCNGEFFRKYGFVSNSGWTGMGGRHDETMCGYGQGLMTQAALMMDDVNTYSRLVEGMTRLAYDGNIVKPLTFDMNPWVFHECFNYENYEEGIDHTFGVLCEGRYGIMDNPGDEGTLVQEAEALKAISMMAGVESDSSGKLMIIPRIPWDWDEVQVKDFPYIDGEGVMGRIDYKMEHERWLRKASIHITSSIPVKEAEVRLGPFPAVTNYKADERTSLEVANGSTWIRIKGLSGTEMEYDLSL